MSSKTWRDVSKMLPPENHPVLAGTIHDEHPYVCAWDGEQWYEYHTSEIIHGVFCWMYFPQFPND